MSRPPRKPKAYHLASVPDLPTSAWDDDLAVPVGADILRAVEGYLERFVAYPSEHARVATVLWAAHAHALDAFESSPRLAFLSPEPGSGKSRALEAMSPLVPAPMHAVNATPAALFRSVADLEHRPTILFDEIDTVFGPKAKDNEEVRGFLNAGHRRGAVAYRCVGEGTRQKVTPFPAFCAVALAGLHALPDTIATRSVIIHMRRRSPDEKVEPFRFRRHEAIGRDLAAELGPWISGHLDQLELAEPSMPEGVVDRAADVWEPLLAVADLAGGEWPQRGRAACLALTGQERDVEPSLGVRLLGDLRAVWADLGDPDGAHTERMLELLRGLDEAPWADLRGRPLDSRGLARLLRRYGIQSASVRVGDRSAKGYRRADLHDAWGRYLPAPEVGHKGHSGDTVGDSVSSQLSATGHDRHEGHDLEAESTRDDDPVTDVTLPRQGEDGQDELLTCRTCGQPMTADLLGDGAHAACGES